ncbi:MAG: pilus assembly protein PilM [Deltaproteobacteria bacterium]|nr:pilus assembly protein PilM [Deltaproteobacteria bacterium]
MRITIPLMPKGELKEALRWEIKGHLPVSIESVQTDFHILHEFVEKGVKKLEVIAVACPHHLIDRVLSIAKGAGLKPTHLDIGAFAFWNVLLAFDGLGKEEVVALVDLGAEKTGVHLFKDGILQFSREITPAGADITRAIMEGIESEEEPYLLYQRAEKIKEEMGIPDKAFQERIDNKTINLSKIPFFVRPVLERLAAEIKRSLDYYRNQFHVERIDRLLLTGGGANLKNITAYLADELRLPVEEFCPFRDLLYDPKKMDEQAVQNLDPMSPMLTIATGVALPALKRIELLPAKEPLWSRLRMDKWVPVVSPLITLLVFSWIFWDMNTREAAIRKERDVKVEKVKTLEMLQSKLKLLKQKRSR